jgi:hypothetical protein
MYLFETEHFEGNSQAVPVEQAEAESTLRENVTLTSLDDLVDEEGEFVAAGSPHHEFLADAAATPTVRFVRTYRLCSPSVACVPGTEGPLPALTSTTTRAQKAVLCHWFFEQCRLRFALVVVDMRCNMPLLVIQLFNQLKKVRREAPMGWPRATVVPFVVLIDHSLAVFISRQGFSPLLS